MSDQQHPLPAHASIEQLARTLIETNSWVREACRSAPSATRPTACCSTKRSPRSTRGLARR